MKVEISIRLNRPEDSSRVTVLPGQSLTPYQDFRHKHFGARRKALAFPATVISSHAFPERPTTIKPWTSELARTSRALTILHRPARKAPSDPRVRKVHEHGEAHADGNSHQERQEPDRDSQGTRGCASRDAQRTAPPSTTRSSQVDANQVVRIGRSATEPVARGR
ncbi:hypothetical protein TIFTF001_017400 [Ficus carica]|uniref:Uncharacterized protein n=1 Tax=Ficus carica TaxID=3494 RepID=A0AA88A7Y9_FICCA|nr:hypothetical protein TIFTF001_017400 [Ficus carica]